MNTILTVGALIVEVAGVVIPILVWVKKIADGQKCQLRSEMLRIYYRNQERKEIRQYEFENFVMLYTAYKALKGNSFIDKIYKEILTWTVIT